ncbi:MAG: hypothetical protein PHU27_00390 [Salinivirgaceae bacterium]|nr:hypothetical protein [Salinivirgaceae bacterium]MDD4746329.1 hypothetical protein [Salinivirgaceae bacterium]
MKMRFSLIVLTVLLLSDCNALFAQEEFNPRKHFIYDGDYFMPYSPYLLTNVGYGYNYKSGKMEQNLAVDYHFRYKFEYLHFNIGYFSSSDQFLREAKGLKIYRSPQRSHHFHMGVGSRYAILKHNFGGYAGISLVRGRQSLTDSMYITRLGPGLYAQIHYHWKPIYDLGIGVAFFATACEHFSVMGLQLSILFSADFKPPAPPKVY